MKNIIGILILLGAYAGALIFKDHQIQKNKSAYVPTIYELQKKNGIPVMVDKVKKDVFREYITLSGTVSKDGILTSAVAPFIKRTLRLGADAFLDLDNGEKRVQGKIISISSSPSLLTGLHDVVVKFNPRLISGSPGEVTVDVPVKELRNVIVVPREGISQRDEKTSAFVLEEGNKISKRIVEIAGSNANEYWIKSGLEADERVITSDTRYFVGGEMVKIMNETRKEL